MAHNVKYDRDEVLAPVFGKVDCAQNMPAWDRWRDTWAIAHQLPDVMGFSLDDLLERFGFDRREEDATHDALTDARLTAQVYLAMMKEIKDDKIKLKSFQRDK